MQPDASYVLQLRAALDAAGFNATRLIVMDGGFDAAEVTTAQSNPAYRAAVHGAGLHYPCSAPHPEVRNLGWTFWSSEDYRCVLWLCLMPQRASRCYHLSNHTSTLPHCIYFDRSRDPAWDVGGRYWGAALNTNYVSNNMTATIAWSLIWSAYTNLVCNGAGLMRAHEPWSGNYEASAPIWLSAHWTQFVTPGWRFLSVPSGSSGFLRLPNGGLAGSYVALVPATGASSGFTMIIETLAVGGCVTRNESRLELTIALSGGLPGPGTQLYVWTTTSSSYFARQTDVVVAADGTVSLAVQPDSVMTMSTTAGATHGSFPGSPVPAAAPFPVPYADAFDGYVEDAMARYFADQGGSWAVRGGTLRQVAEADPGANAWAPNPDPLTMIGGEDWEDYAVAADATFSRSFRHLSVSGATSQREPPSAKRAAAIRSRRNAWLAGRGEPLIMDDSRPTLAQTSVALAPCDVDDPAQRWSFDVIAPGYLANERAGANSAADCLNVGSCTDNSIITYQCLVDASGSSCGAPPGQYPNLVWSYNATSGALITAMDGKALTLDGDSGLLVVAPFTGAASQLWTRNDTARSFALRGVAGGCLSTPPVETYVQVCGRITSFNGFNAIDKMPGYCIKLNTAGNWTLVVGGAPVTSGTVPLPFDPTSPHRLALSFAGTIVTATIDAQVVASVNDATFSRGNAALGSGWHVAGFDNFAVTSS